MGQLGRNAFPIAVTLTSLLLWASFAWALQPEAPASEAEADIGTSEGVWRCGNCDAENVPLAKYCTKCGAKKGGEAEVAPKDPWAGVKISDAYDYAKCPRCGHKNAIRRPACYRCGYSLPEPSGEVTDPAWVFVPGKGYYREGTLLEPGKKRTGLIITGYALLAAGAAAVIGAAAYEGSEEAGLYLGFIGGPIIGGAGGALLIIGYATRKDPVYALNPRGLNENGLTYTCARRTPDSDGAALKVEVTLISF